MHSICSLEFSLARSWKRSFHCFSMRLLPPPVDVPPSHRSSTRQRPRLCTPLPFCITPCFKDKAKNPYILTNSCLPLPTSNIYTLHRVLLSRACLFLTMRWRLCMHDYIQWSVPKPPDFLRTACRASLLPLPPLLWHSWLKS